jgi:hypothetical protein
MKKIYLFLLLSVFSVTGCATSMKVTPTMEEFNCHQFHIGGTIHYNKNIQYLPRTIKSENMAEKNDSLFFYYDYQVSYGRDYLFNSGELVPLFNPLTLIGSPIGEDDVCVVGKLDILHGGKVVKTYKSVCLLEKIRNLFYQGETFSEMRKKGLFAVRNNIETQMCQDKEFLIHLTGQEK